jgi:hypothetical protein
VEDCAQWAGKHWNTGYPYMMGGERGHRKMIAMHRWTWEQANGPIPPGCVIMHTCDNRGCINLEHLRLGTPKANSSDMARKGRASNAQKMHCPMGHEYDRTTHRRSGGRAGQSLRYCSICANERRRRRYRGARDAGMSVAEAMRRT